MKRQRRWLLGFLFTVLSLVLIGVMGIAWLGFASLPQRDVSLPLAGLTHPVRIEFDDWGIPRIQGQTRSDVFQALGFVTAQDRLFQMDLLRRSSAGRLAEIFGPELLPLDRRNRTLGYEKLSREILANLPEGQRAVLQAYSRGVNQALAGLRVLPFEFLLLNYRPEPWREEDSLLIILGLHAMLTGLGDQERTVTVMEAVLPPAAVAFFTPDTDPFSLRLPPQKNDSSVLEPIPVAALKSQLTANTAPKDPANIVSVPFLGAGSNGWVVAPGKMYHGRALLANDMHLTDIPHTLFHFQE
jgi:penicillin G amidase